MNARASLVLTSVLVLAAGCSAYQGATPRTLSQETEQSGSPLDRLAFMAGAWAAEHNGVAMEEQWLEPRGGLMLGVHLRSRIRIERDSWHVRGYETCSRWHDGVALP